MDHKGQFEKIIPNKSARHLFKHEDVDFSTPYFKVLSSGSCSSSGDQMLLSSSDPLMNLNNLIASMQGDDSNSECLVCLHVQQNESIVSLRVTKLHIDEHDYQLV